MKNDTLLMRALIDAKADQSAKVPNGMTLFTENIAMREAAGREAAQLEAARKAAPPGRAALEAVEAERKAASATAGTRRTAPDPGLADLALAIIKIGTGGGGA